jgi:hypothetical protein
MQAYVIHRGNRPVHIGNANHFVATRKFLGFAFRRKFGLRGQLNEVGQGTLWKPEAWLSRQLKADSYFGCSVCAIMTCRLKFSTIFSLSRTSVGFFARVI